MMTFGPTIIRLTVTTLLLATATAAASQKTAAPPQDKTQTQAPAPAVVEEKPTPYDQRLIRLAEVLGSVHYLRNLCVKEPEDVWRRSMQQLIDKETANEEKRRERMTAAFNRGIAPLPLSTRPARSRRSSRNSDIVPKEQHLRQKSSLALEISNKLTSFLTTPCRFGKRLLSSLREW